MRIKVLSENSEEWVEKEIDGPEIVAKLSSLVSKSSEKVQEEKNMVEIEKEKFLTPEDVAERLNLSTRQVLEFAQKGVIPSIRYNARVIRFAESQLAEFIRTGRGK